MTVAELIEELQKYPPHAPVVYDDEKLTPISETLGPLPPTQQRHPGDDAVVLR